MKKPRTRRWVLLAASAWLGLVSGCAGTSINWPTTNPKAPLVASSGDPLPRVQNCSTIDVGSPTKYICSDGKVYTSHQLQKIRETGTLAKK